MSLIRISDMHFYAHHGCFEQERRIGTHFSVDVVLSLDTSRAQLSDCLDHTVNYADVYASVKSVMDTPAHLLEHLAHRIAVSILDTYSSVQSVNVVVRKLNPPLGGQVASASVELSLSRCDGADVAFTPQHGRCPLS